VLDIDRVVEALNRLDDVLARGNPAAANIELSMHIDRIDCHPDRRVVVRTCKLGALAGAADLLRAETALPVPLAPTAEPVARELRQRRRPPLRVTEDDLPGVDVDDAVWTAADSDRFAGLGPEWFWLDEFRCPRPTNWAKEQAAEVARVRRETGWPVSRLAEHFGKSENTVRRALNLAPSGTKEQNDDRDKGRS
jgi:hypothetical protein